MGGLGWVFSFVCLVCFLNVKIFLQISFSRIEASKLK